MLKILYTSSAVLFLSGCSMILTSASESDPGIFAITARGNAFHSEENLLAKALVKAEKKCGHADFDEVSDRKTGKTKVYGAVISYAPYLTIVVDCHARESD